MTDHPPQPSQPIQPPQTNPPGRRVPRSAIVAFVAAGLLSVAFAGGAVAMVADQHGDRGEGHRERGEQHRGEYQNGPRGDRDGNDQPGSGRDQNGK